MNLIEKLKSHSEKIAAEDSTGIYSYKDLLVLASKLKNKIASCNLKDGSRIAMLASPGKNYLSSQIAIWLSGNTAVPLCSKHSPDELNYIISDSSSQLLICDDLNQKKIQSCNPKVTILNIDAVNDLKEASLEDLKELTEESEAIILYTSGTTSKPKGVIISHKTLKAQIITLVKAWDYRSDDRILHTLPLHHTHGIVNAMLCVLYAGGCCIFLDKFDDMKVWDSFERKNINLFMAVPTIYQKLTYSFESLSNEKKDNLKSAFQNFRLMVSGSAALPVPLFEKWREITGHILLERYGMTEIGMALSNPYKGERRAGSVGLPLPGIEIKLVDEIGNRVRAGEAGEIYVRGENVFKAYNKRADESLKSFSNGFFKTGDIAIEENGYFRILGRKSMDIIKSGGYKISALEIESAALAIKPIKECAVFGKEDKDWGEIICMAYVQKVDNPIDESFIREELKKKLASYKIPRLFFELRELPKNPTGKLDKKKLKADLS